MSSGFDLFVNQMWTTKLPTSSAPSKLLALILAHPKTLSSNPSGYQLEQIDENETPIMLEPKIQNNFEFWTLFYQKVCNLSNNLVNEIDYSSRATRSNKSIPQFVEACYVQEMKTFSPKLSPKINDKKETSKLENDSDDDLELKSIFLDTEFLDPEFLDPLFLDSVFLVTALLVTSLLVKAFLDPVFLHYWSQHYWSQHFWTQYFWNQDFWTHYLIQFSIVPMVWYGQDTLTSGTCYWTLNRRISKESD
ncbi:hypothetical protein BpHYR1_020875 [Brachionus plicatilis]|uniref:Uncharacterized protein n=1 Tax=Brachionus plicatilis TaxID=10195 RepID=A0A3M7S4X6_BRAPC|nr:hypothetical protein BpHYR1_020875 [Brachionus plicatilis]